MANRFIGGVLSSKQPQSSGFVSRASTGTYFNQTGTLVTAPVNQPRVNYSFNNNPISSRYSGLFSGNSRLSVAQTTATDLGSANFTIEMWIYFTGQLTAGDTNNNIVGKFNATGQWILQFRAPGLDSIANQHWRFYFNSSSGTDFQEASTTAVELNRWHHIAVVRNGSSFIFYRNGVQVGSTFTSSATITATSDTMTIGSSQNNVYGVTGYISNFRMVTGTAVYTGAFTVPTGVLTATQSANPFGGSNTAAIASGTQVLTLQNSGFTDNSSNNFTLSNIRVASNSNLPPLNYTSDFSGTGWSNPTVLIEPASTNIITYSEQIDNAVWSKIAFNTRTGITANAATAPDGNTTADLVYVVNGQTSVSGGAYWPYTFTTGVTYTWSCYFKAAGYTYVYMGSDNNNASCAWFNLATGTTGTASTGFRGTITTAGNGWYRCAVTFTFAPASMGNAGPIMGCANIDGTVTLTQAGNGSNGVYMWGAQMEVNSLGATSYIPTVASAVTRAQDTTGVVGSGLYTLGQLENQTSIDDQFTVQSFPNVGSNYNWTAPEDVVSVEVLVVAGGGGANNSAGGNSTGGGGGGGVVYNTNYPVVPGVTYPIVVGAGGTPAASNSVNPLNGGNSQFGNLIAIGGGWGKGRDTTGSSGGNGGSGGGGDTYGNVGGRGISGQGYSGGNGLNFSSGVSGGGGGGGGAAGPGSNAVVQAGGVNGPGLGLTISGTLVYYGAGGVGQSTGGSNTTPIAGGTASNTNGAANTGAGGAGGTTNNGTSTGGSGIVIVKYKRTNRQLAVVSNAAVVTQKFITSNIWTAPAGVTQIEVLVVAGGGSGGNFHGGGGGAGGVIYNNALAVTPGSLYTLAVGAGGDSVTVTRGINGNNSAFGLNLISNSQFTTNVASWTIIGSSTISWSNANNGSAIVTPGGAAWHGVYQAITTVVGHVYYATALFVSGSGYYGFSATEVGAGHPAKISYTALLNPANALVTFTWTATGTTAYIAIDSLNTTNTNPVTVKNITVINATTGLYAVGGGGGGNEQVSQTGVSGGSGGGGSYTGSGGAGTAGQGNAGGTAVSISAAYAAAGGGGAGSAGGNPPTFSIGGAGGTGLPFSITGNLEYYAGGGGGSVYNATTIGFGGLGGGGNGGSFSGTIAATNGSANTGGGGGGGERAAGAANSGAGGSGVVIIRYRVPQIAVFQDSGTWTCPSGVTSVQALIVAGGGGGGSGSTGSQLGGGGGGAGGLIYDNSIPVTPRVTYSVVVGQGGTGGIAVTRAGTNGQNSSFSNLIAIGGGFGGVRGISETGGSGGSGGAGAGNPVLGGTGTYGQGNNGAGSQIGAFGGGGGGAGAVGSAGQSATEPTGASGGIGLQFSIGGTATYYAGGGSGGAWGGEQIIPSSLGGGGVGGPYRQPGRAGTQNTGGGGGGSGSGYRNADTTTAATSNGGAGGSGIVIIRWYGG
jgi:hypothetical protein